MRYDSIAQSAKRIFRDHEVTIELDQGVHRSIHFAAPNTSAYSFRLNTWSGHLCFSGDLGTYTFSRVRDMFSFFASEDDWASMPLDINPQYWFDKCYSFDRHGEAQEFDRKAFVSAVVRDFRDLDFSEYPAGARVQAFQELRNEVLERVWLDEKDTIDYAMNFTIQRLDENGYCATEYPFQDAWDYSFKKFTNRYLFACYAIVWGIKRYAQTVQGRSQADTMAAVLKGEL